MIRTLVAVGLALHGLIHLIGFIVPFRLAELPGYSFTTTAAWGRIELGDAGARALGLVWLVTAVPRPRLGIGRPRPLSLGAC